MHVERQARHEGQSRLDTVGIRIHLLDLGYSIVVDFGLELELS